ncbi:hypothetical protein QQM39_44125 [Streptomyces sp. DT2A-34]|uniref:hypothetical protein n=1 Tax=Streptomyces sp. DT2A-34 TaxID=3051182 RepID=UPI00265C8904|nr:hypothetical protein [Streptomyces sp. DT2A-34]MDO0917532.1 hypothetical protein [Streptomyces sp. DT2A-34]
MRPRVPLPPGIPQQATGEFLGGLLTKASATDGAFWFFLNYWYLQVSSVAEEADHCLAPSMNPVP